MNDVLNRNERLIADGAAPQSDEELLQLMQAGDGDYAFSLLVQRHSARFFSLAYRIVGRADEAEDVVQEAFIRVWRDPFKFSLTHGARFMTWFYRIVTNLALDAQRRNKHTVHAVDVTLLEDLQDGSMLPDERRQQDDMSAGLLTAMRGLPLRQQIAIELHYFDSLTQKDAAYVMQLTEKAYQSLLHRGKQKLKKVLPPDMLVGTS